MVKEKSKKETKKSNGGQWFLIIVLVSIVIFNALIFIPHKTVGYTVDVPYQTQESYFVQVPYNVQESYLKEVEYEDTENVKVSELSYEIVGDRNPDPKWIRGGFLFIDGYWKVVLNVKNTDSEKGCITVHGKILEGTKNRDLRTQAKERKCLVPGEIGDFDFTYNGYHSDDVDFEYTIDSGVYEDKEVTKTKQENSLRTVTKYRMETKYRTVTKTRSEQRYKQVNWLFKDRCFIGCENN